AAYRKQFSFLMPGKPLIVEAVSVEVIASGGVHEEREVDGKKPGNPVESIRVFTGGKWHAAPLYRREDLGAGQRIDGPAVIAEAHATTVVEPEWRATLTPLNHLVLDRVQSRRAQTVIRLNAGRMRPGNVYVLNAPYNGGTHLPDVTVITPVFDSRQILFYVGSRGHHADIGGITPGSMPPESKLVEEEGVLIDNFLLVEQGRFREKETVALLTSGKYPVRNVEQNVADLRAQVAANEKGVQELRRMVEHFGLDVVRAYMRHVQDNAEESVRRVIGVLKDGEFD